MLVVSREFYPLHIDSCTVMGGRGIRFLSSSAPSCRKIEWDPTLSLQLNHPSLVLLEKSNSRDHFKQILGQIMRCNLIGKTFPMSRLILFSAISHPENLDMALILFNHYTPNPNLYIYNTMISALDSVNGQAFGIYGSMLRSGIYPDKHTLIHLLRAAKNLLEVKQIHCQAVVTGCLSYGYLQNSLVKMYLKNGLLCLAHKVFEHMLAPDAVSFNVMINGYAKKGCGLEVLQLFRRMVDWGLEPDEYTMLGLLIACGQLRHVKLGKAVHAWMKRRKAIWSSNMILDNALLDMYVKCQDLELVQKTFGALTEKDVFSWNTIIAGCAKVGEMELAQAYFDQMPSKDIVSWNSIIAGCASGGNFAMVGKLFSDMVGAGVTPDNVTMVCFISAAAEIGALNQGRWAHGWLIRMRIKICAFLGSALIDMYCKCGHIERAFTVFSQVTEKDIRVWTTMITGFAFHGYGLEALKLFSKMQDDVIPNEVTFVSLLTACSHGGLVDLGIKIFNGMKEYGIEPGIEHYGCLVDLLGRSGRVAEAKDVIEWMPMKASRSIWGTMLNACRAQGDVETAEIALKELLKLEPEDEGGYILLSNIYAARGRWIYSDKIREIMDSRGVKKAAGCSSVVVNGIIHNFVAADNSHPIHKEVRFMLNCLKNEMKLQETFSV